MPKKVKKIKVKSHSGAKKRFDITPSGRIKYQSANRRHRLAQKGTKRNRTNKSGDYCDKTNVRAIKTMLPYA